MPSPPAETSVSISATLDYNGNPIVINTGDLNDLRQGKFVFNLAQPVVLGSVDDFLHWLHTKWDLPDLAADVKEIGTVIEGKPIIGELYQAFEAFLAGIISIDLLSINTTDPNNKSFKLSVSLTLSPPLNLFGPINFDSLGVLVSHQGA
jgi:hypothetical protein